MSNYPLEYVCRVNNLMGIHFFLVMGKSYEGDFPKLTKCLWHFITIHFHGCIFTMLETIYHLSAEKPHKTKTNFFFWSFLCSLYSFRLNFIFFLLSLTGTVSRTFFLRIQEKFTYKSYLLHHSQLVVLCWHCNFNHFWLN